MRGPVNVHGNGGYTLGCRCDECAAGRLQLNRVYRRANARAAQWFRAHHPDAWDQLVSEAYDYHRVERREIGRPRGAA